MTTSSISHRYLPQAAYTVEPWKNGLGSTDIIAEERVENAPAAGWDGLVWRLARTGIAAALPFSDHSGFERHQVVTEGEGLYLDTASGTIDLSKPLKPVRYGGELKLVARLERGAVEVLNLMVDRRLARGEMTALVAPSEHIFAAGKHFISAVAGAARIVVRGVAINIAEGDAVAVAVALEATTAIAVTAGSAVISSVYGI